MFVALAALCAFGWNPPQGAHAAGMQGLQAQERQQAPAITEEQLRQQLQGKTFYLREGYLENTLQFDQDGRLDGNSPKASFTLSLVQIERVHLEKHKLTLVGVRFGLHFLAAAPTDDQAQAVDKVRLTSKKKPLRITISREVVEKPKKPRHEKGPQTMPSPEDDALAGVPEAERQGLRVTTSQEHANHALQQALNRVLTPEIDKSLVATLPEPWQLYYKSVEQRTMFRPADPAVLRENQVDTKARLLSAVQPKSNEYAQNNGVAGPALYHVVLGADGKPQAIAIGRPIGFGLDENAIDAIRTAKFEPAMKSGKPVPVVLDVSVQFRIFSRRTAEATDPAKSGLDDKPKLPGPYTARELQEQQQKAAQDAAAQQQPAQDPAAQQTPASSQSPADQAAPQKQPAQQPETKPQLTPQ
jgi:TonB family protein